MKNSNVNSIMGKYSDGKISNKKSEGSKLPLMATYEQRYKGGMTKSITEPAHIPTLDEKIAERNIKPVVTDEPIRVPVEIGGNRYLLSTAENFSEDKIRKIALTANKFFEEARSTNPGLTNSKAAILALVDACELLLQLRSENDSLKTELLYLQNQEYLASRKNKKLTPMDELVQGGSSKTETDDKSEKKE